jgi:hypothetical protein
MDQQEQGRQSEREPSPNSQQAEQAKTSRDGATSWGVGSASALDSLRRQNFRGKRHAPSQEKPASE